MRHGFCLILIASCLAVVGCSKPANQNIEIKVDAMAGVRTLLEGYAKGQPLRSEVTLFPDYVNTVRKVDPAKADILEKGLEDIKKPGTDIRAKAKELMGKVL